MNTTASDSQGDAATAHRQRRRAVSELGSALRELNEAAVSTEVDVDTLREAAAQAREMTSSLEAASRTREQVPSVDSANIGRYYNPAVGPGHPFAPPLQVDIVDGVVVGTCTLGLMHEGPHTYVHGGVSAMLLDQVLGHAHALRGRSGMTVALSLRYRRPVPLQTPLRIAGWIAEDQDRSGRTHPTATITTADDPDTVLVRAEGTFVVPSKDQLRRLFGESSEWVQSRQMVGE